MRHTLLLICGLLVIIVLLVSTTSPEMYLIQEGGDGTSPSPTPPSTQKTANNALHRQSGETQWLKIGAAVIVFVILGGILFQQGQDPSETTP